MIQHFQIHNHKVKLTLKVTCEETVNEDNIYEDVDDAKVTNYVAVVVVSVNKEMVNNYSVNVAQL